MERVIKVIIVGDPNVGKTNFARRYSGRPFIEEYKCTFGCDFASKKIALSAKEEVMLSLWDIGGQDRFRRLTRVFYRGALAAVIMCDVTNRQSLDHVVEWKNELDDKVSLPDGGRIPCMLLANKSDLTGHQVSDYDLKYMVQDHGFTGWSKTSAKDYINIDEPMRILLDKIIALEKSKGNLLASGSFELTGSLQLRNEAETLNESKPPRFFCFY